MTSLVNLCKKYFGHENLYDVLGIPKNASEQQGNFFLYCI